MSKLISFLTHEEINKLLKATKTKRLKMARALGAGSGLRISEIVGRKDRHTKCCNSPVEDFVVESSYLKRKKCSKCKKTVSSKDLYLSRKEEDWSIPPLDQDKVDLKNHQIRIIQGKGKKDRITVTSPWLNKTNIQLLPIKMPIRTLQYQFNRLTEQVLKTRHNFHILRHSFGNYMVVEKSVPITVVQQLMGHARLGTTGIYSQANPKQAIKQAWEAF